MDVATIKRCPIKLCGEGEAEALFRTEQRKKKKNTKQEQAREERWMDEARKMVEREDQLREVERVVVVS